MVCQQTNGVCNHNSKNEINERKIQRSIVILLEYYDHFKGCDQKVVGPFIPALQGSVGWPWWIQVAVQGRHLRRGFEAYWRPGYADGFSGFYGPENKRTHVSTQAQLEVHEHAEGIVIMHSDVMSIRRGRSIQTQEWAIEPQSEAALANR